MKRWYVLLTLTLLVGMAPCLYAQIPNAGFETWVAGTPTGWVTTNIDTVVVAVTRSTTARSGSSALKGAVVNTTVFGTFPPYAASYFGYKQRPGSLTGYYQFTGVSSDSFGVYVGLYTGAGFPIAVGFFETSVNRAAWTQFAAPLEYLSPGTPDSAYIWILSLEGRDDSNHVGTTFLIDDLAFTGSATDVERQPSLPTSYALNQNYPNPFNPTTVISFELPVTSAVRLGVSDMLGREVALLLNETMDPGSHAVRFDAAGFPSGTYFYRLQAGEYVATKRLMLLK